MFKLASELLDPHGVAARTVDVPENAVTLTRELQLLPVDPSCSYGEGKGPDESVWAHAKTFLRVTSTKRRDGEVVEQDVRLFVSSRATEHLTPDQWLYVCARSLGRREQQPPHLRHRLRRGRPAVDRG
jgi:hypothetical protein